MFDWLKRNAEALSALGGITTAVAAFVALMVVPYQIHQADRIQRDQTAREIYREFLNLSVQKPELAQANYCAMTDETQITAYVAYVDYLLYTADQMVETSPEWRRPMASYVAAHLAYLCGDDVWNAQPDEIHALVTDLGLACTPEVRCK